MNIKDMMEDSLPNPVKDYYIAYFDILGYRDQIKHLKPGEAPKADFAVTEPVIAAYEYCNLHGLWMAKA